MDSVAESGICAIIRREAPHQAFFSAGDQKGHRDLMAFRLIDAWAAPDSRMGNTRQHHHSALRRFTSGSAWGQVARTALRPPGKFALLVLLLRSDLIYRLKIFLTPRKQLRRCKVKPHGSLVPVSSTHCCAYTPGLSTSSCFNVPSGLSGVRVITHLGVVLRSCFQHLSLPHFATGQCHWDDNPNTKVHASTPVLLYECSPPQFSSAHGRGSTVSRRSKPELANHFKWRTAIPWDLLQPQLCDEPTSRCQTPPSI